ncbi:transposase [Candidatus Magnetoovum chiemensis]|nr:transposase [Candidatus Magnetoovum chiemensis]
MSGITEADETYFLKSVKGQRDICRQPRKRGGKSKKPGLSSEQIPVLLAKDRNGETFDCVLPSATKEQIGKALKPVLGKDTLLCTDGSRALRATAKEFGIPHQAMNIKAGTRVKERIFHIQNVNSYASRLKGWMRRFNGVASKYIESYLGWMRFFERHEDEAFNSKIWLINSTIHLST